MLPPLKFNQGGGIASTHNHSAFKVFSLGRVFILGLEFFFLIIIAIMLARLVWMLLYGAAVPAVIPTQNFVTMSDKKASEINAETLTGFDPFYRNIATLEDNTEEEAYEDSPETSLNLKLLGTRASLLEPSAGRKTSAIASAIIENPNGKQEIYRIGQEIIDNVSLSAIYADYVILLRGGIKERLSLDENSTLIVADNPQLRTIRRTGGRGGDVKIPSLGNDLDTRQKLKNFIKNTRKRKNISDSGKVDNDKVNDNIETVKSGLAELSQTQLRSLFSSINLVPVINGRKVEGWTMNPIGPASLFQSVGFQGGDVLKNINGQELTNAAQIKRIVDELQATTSISFLIEREGASKMLSFKYNG